jgi:hypothetical protein
MKPISDIPPECMYSMKFLLSKSLEGKIGKIFSRKKNKKKNTPITKRRSLSTFRCRYTNKRSTKRKMHKTKIPQTNANPKRKLGLEINQQEDEGKKEKNQYHYQGASIHCCMSRRSQNCLSLDDGIR